MISQCDLIKDFKLKDFQKWINDSFLADLYTLVKVNARKDQNKQLKDVELVLVNNRNQKESSIYLTDFNCSDGLLESHWVEFIQAKVGQKKWCHNLLGYYNQMNKPREFEELYEDDNDNLKM